MPLIIAAIRTGHDPIGKLPEGSFHRWLDEPLICPKCSATYNLVCDYNQSVGRFFEEESRRLILLLKKAIFLAHARDDHKAPHLETNGVVVTSYLPSPPAKPPTIH